MCEEGISEKDAIQKIWMVDSKGLIVKVCINFLISQCHILGLLNVSIRDIQILCGNLVINMLTEWLFCQPTVRNCKIPAMLSD